MLKREAVIVHSSRIETAYHRLSNLLRPKSQKYKLFGPRYWKYAAVALLALLITIDIFMIVPRFLIRQIWLKYLKANV